MTALRGWGLPEQHLALDALVAFVDGELSPVAYDRAAAHLARCPSCAADAAAQRQARSAVRKAAPPSMSPQFLQTLQSIPASAELPAQPDGLALTQDGRLVTVNRRDSSAELSSTPVVGGTSPLGTGQAPLGQDESQQQDHPEAPKAQNGRRAKQGAGVVFSGIVLGALAFMNLPTDAARNTVNTVPPPSPLGGGGAESAATTSAATTGPGTASGSTGTAAEPAAPSATASLSASAAAPTTSVDP